MKKIVPVILAIILVFCAEAFADRKFYIIRKGDTLSEIEFYKRLPAGSLEEWNPGTGIHNIYPGQKIYLEPENVPEIATKELKESPARFKGMYTIIILLIGLACCCYAAVYIKRRKKSKPKKIDTDAEKMQNTIEEWRQIEVDGIKYSVLTQLKEGKIISPFMTLENHMQPLFRSNWQNFKKAMKGCLSKDSEYADQLKKLLIDGKIRIIS